MRLLIVEDNRELADSMKSGLEEMKYQVELAYAGAIGEEKAFVNPYDAILLDLNLPDKDGIEILEFLRESEVETPIIIVTARDEINQRVQGLDLGADDYMTKPFDLLELHSRVQAVVRRFYGRTKPAISIGDLEINPLKRTAFYKEEPLELRVKEFDILECIAQKHPAVVSTEEIAEHVYGEDYDPFSSVLRVHIARLKKILSEAAGKPVLKTIRGKGYHL